MCVRVVLGQPCDRVRNQLSLDLDGELSRLEQAMVSRHLEECLNCRIFSDDVARFTASLREAPLEMPERLIVIPRGGSFIGEARSVIVRAGAAAAGIAVVIMLGFSNSGVVGSKSHTASARPAYGQSIDYELKLMQQEIGRSNGVRNTVAV